MQDIHSQSVDELERLRHVLLRFLEMPRPEDKPNAATNHWAETLSRIENELLERSLNLERES